MELAGFKQNSRRGGADYVYFHEELKLHPDYRTGEIMIPIIHGSGKRKMVLFIYRKKACRVIIYVLNKSGVKPCQD